MVGARGFEPPTPTTPLWCATRLRYAPKTGLYSSSFKFPFGRLRNQCRWLREFALVI